MDPEARGIVLSSHTGDYSNSCDVRVLLYQLCYQAPPPSCPTRPRPTLKVGLVSQGLGLHGTCMHVGPARHLPAACRCAML